MKNKNQNQMATEDADSSFEQGNGINGKTHIKLSDADKQKGNFKNFEISKKTIKKLKARNVECLFPVQSESYTSIYERNDCLIQASSGSGKTLAYVIPLVELLQSDKSTELVSGRAPRVLVVTPTRDTAKPISDEFESVVNDLAVATIYTTKKKSDDQETAVTNGCDILVATPDRLKEFIDEEKVDLSQIKHVVLDEVDELVDDLKKTLKNVFTSDQETKAQLIVLSEAAPDALRKALKKFLSTDAVTFNLAEQTKEEAAADGDEDEDDDEDDEKPVNGSSTNTSGASDDGPRSLLSKQPNYTTYQLSTNDEIKGVGFVFTMLRKSFGDDFDAKGAVPQIAFTKDYKCAIFDLESKYDEQLQSAWKDSARIQMGPITKLPELDEASMNDHNIFTRGSRSGGGDRNSGRSSACFNCQKEGHKSFECPEGKNSGRNGGYRSGGGGGGGGCFNCGKDGHKSFECAEPKKAGGRGGSGGAGAGGCFNCGKDGHKSFECSEPKKERSSFGGRGGSSAGGGGGCFNCSKDGHKSFECPEPKKERSSFGGRGGSSAGGGGGCFNCGKDGHKSFECPEPKKERSSFGGRGGSRGGGAGGAKRSFGGGYGNGVTATEPANNKKIKFDDDD